MRGNIRQINDYYPYGLTWSRPEGDDARMYQNKQWQQNEWGGYTLKIKIPINPNSGCKIIGPAKVMAVKKGEKIDLSTKYWYTEVPGEPLTSIAEILAGTLLNLGSASSGIIPEGPETGMALLNNISGNQFGSFSNIINDDFIQNKRITKCMKIQKRILR